MCQRWRYWQFSTTNQSIWCRNVLHCSLETSLCWTIATNTEHSFSSLHSLKANEQSIVTSLSIKLFYSHFQNTPGSAVKRGNYRLHTKTRSTNVSRTQRKSWTRSKLNYILYSCLFPFSLHLLKIQHTNAKAGPHSCCFLDSSLITIILQHLDEQTGLLNDLSVSPGTLEPWTWVPFDSLKGTHAVHAVPEVATQWLNCCLCKSSINIHQVDAATTVKNHLLFGSNTWQFLRRMRAPLPPPIPTTSIGAL